jgi:acyl-coenzyme A thioesterase PaaI-like protein
MGDGGCDKPAMSDSVEATMPDAPRADATAASVHAACAVCGDQRRNPDSLGLTFTPQPDGSVVAHFVPARPQQGYPGLVHGGILCMLLDAAMTHCLFARGIRALTAELTVRFVAPAALGREMEVRGHLVAQRRRMSHLGATIHQDGQLVARATAAFLQPKAAPAGSPVAADTARPSAR